MKLAENSEKTATRGRGRPFRKGTSGNPAGRPREEKELVAALRLHGLEFVDKLVALARKGNVKAIEVALNRAYGKVKQVVELKDLGEPRRTWDLNLLNRDQLQQLMLIQRIATGMQPPLEGAHVNAPTAPATWPKPIPSPFPVPTGLPE